MPPHPRNLLAWLAVAACSGSPPADLPTPTPTPAPAPPPVCEAGPPPSWGPLSGLLVFLSAGHGKMLQAGNFDYQREWGAGILEDLWTARFANEVLAPRLEAAGARVVTLRERDPGRSREVIEEEALRTRAGATRTPDPAAWGGSWLKVPAGQQARLDLRATESGPRTLSLRWLPDPSLGRQHHVTLRRGQEAFSVVLDQQARSDLWWPLFTLDLVAGEPLELCFQAADGDLGFDALRWGGGQDGPSGPPPAPAWEVVPLHRQAWMGGPPELALLPDGEPISDIRYRARWAAYAAGDEPAVYLSLHTDAAGGRGSTVFYGVDDDPPLPPHPLSRALAEALVTRLVPATQAHDPAWTVRPPRAGNFSEISPKWSPIPGILFEVGFHDRARDTRWLQQPAFQDAVAGAILQALRDVWAPTPEVAPRLLP